MGRKRAGRSERVLIEQLVLNRVRGEYRLRLVTTDGFETEMRTDDRLGCIMSAWSVALKALAQHRGETGAQPTTEMKTGSVVLSYYHVVPLTVFPYAYRIVMHGHGFSYTCNVDRDLEHVMLAYSGAMKFFATKLGVTVLYEEVIRNTEAAAELGFLTNGRA